LGAITASIAITALDFPAASSARPGDWSEGGQRGDFWGGHVASGASLAGTMFFLLALLLQSRELRAQGKQLAATQEFQKQQADSTQKLSENAAAQARALEVQSRLAWEGTVTALVTQAVRLRQEYEVHRQTANQGALNGFKNAAERSEKLVDDLTRRGSDEFVMPLIRDAWRDATGLPRLRQPPQ